MFFDRDKADLRTVQCHSPGCLALASPAPASCRKSLRYCNLEGWLWPGLPNTFEVSLSLRHFLHLELFWSVVTDLGLGSWIRHDLEICRHIFYVFGIQTLGSKLSSEHWLNHPSFSVNTRTQLPAQLLRYFELKLYVLARIAFYFFITWGKNK